MRQTRLGLIGCLQHMLFGTIVTDLSPSHYSRWIVCSLVTPPPGPGSDGG